MEIRARGSRRGVPAQRNVVPLIGMRLVLLIIFFMVITPPAPRGLDAHIPQPQKETLPSAPNPGIIVVAVTSGGGLRISREAVAWEAGGGRSEARFAARAAKVGLLRGAGVVKVGSLSARP